MRSDDNPAGVGLKSISTDRGLTWEGPYAAGYWPISGRINGGRLSTGETMVTHRVGGFHPQGWFGYFIESPETALLHWMLNHECHASEGLFDVRFL